MKKRLLSILLSLCMLLSLLPAVSPMVSAAASTAVYVGGENVVDGGYWVSDGAGGITADGASESNYTVNYEPSTHTLTLNGATITKCFEWSGSYAAAIYANGDLNLKLLGNNNVIGQDFMYSFGVFQDYGMLTISGSGSLNATGGTAQSLSYGIKGDTIAIYDTTIVADGDTSNQHSFGIGAYGLITITDSTVDATGGLIEGEQKYAGSTGISSNNKIKISGGCVTAIANNAYYASSAIFGVYGVEISGDAVVRAEAGDVTGSEGDSCGIATNLSNVSIIISGGSVTAQSGAAPTSSAIRTEPDLSEYTGYEWRTSDSGTFSTDAYTWLATDTYVEFRQGFIPVTAITMTNATTVAVNTDLTLTATVAPTNATNKTVSWSVTDRGDTNAVITDGIFRADTVGTATVTATVENGVAEDSDYTQSFTITVTKAPTGGNSGGTSGSTPDDSADSILDSATGIRARGAISGSLTISLLTDTATGRANEVVNPIVYSELMRSVGSGHAVIGAYEIKASGYSGNLILTFPVDARHNGKQYVVKHKTTSGTIQTYRGTVLDGKIVISVSELSPFMIAIKDGVLIPETGAAGFFDYIRALLQGWFHNVWGRA